MYDPVEPYGGVLKENLCTSEKRRSFIDATASYRSLQLTDRQVCDLELLLSGAFSPLDRFMGLRDYESVVTSMRLADGVLFPIPITLAVEQTENFTSGEQVALRDKRNDVLAILTVEEVYEWSREAFCEEVLGTNDSAHPLVAESSSWGRYHLSGKLDGIQLPAHHSFADLRLTPRQTRDRLKARGIRSIAAFQTRNPIHRAHEALIRQALRRADSVLVHPVVGMTKPDDVDTFTRVRTYRALFDSHLRDLGCELAVTPLAMRFAGPREALWHAIIRRNYGADKFIVGRDHASPGVGSDGKPFYNPDAARDLAVSHSTELGIEILHFDEFVYSEVRDDYIAKPFLNPGERVRSISGSEARRDYLDSGVPLPQWFTRPEVARILASSYTPRGKQGFCLWFTGLSGAGKTTTAEILVTMLAEQGRKATLLDGDVVRTNLSKGLGFSRDDRDTNIRRIGFVAAEIVKHDGIAVCAAISPYAATRAEVRAMMEPGRFIEIFVEASIEGCEARDTKGMYKKAREGVITDFTGINSPYEAPSDPELVIDGESPSPTGNAAHILRYLQERGFAT